MSVFVFYLEKPGFQCYTLGIYKNDTWFYVCGHENGKSSFRINLETKVSQIPHYDRLNYETLFWEI